MKSFDANGEIQITLPLAVGDGLRVVHLELHKENLALIAYGPFDH